MDNTEVKTLKDIEVEYTYGNPVQKKTIRIPKGEIGVICSLYDSAPDVALIDLVPDGYTGDDYLDYVLNLTRDVDFEVLEYFDEKGNAIPAAEYEERWRKAHEN